MSKVKNESARHSMERIARLERRLRQLVAKPYKTGSNTGEISAIEWALPILEKHVVDTYGYAPAMRANYYKHEKQWLIETLLARDGDVCYLCQQQIPRQQMTIDHVIPLSKGGQDDTTNYKLVHDACNIEKGNLMLDDFLAGKSKAQEA